MTPNMIGMFAIDDRVEDACKKARAYPCRVDYAAYQTDENDVPIDNLDDIAATGKIRLVMKKTKFYCKPQGKDYQSDILESPTWLTVAVCADRMIKTTRDYHHVFLEGITKLPDSMQTEEGVTLYTFDMGS